MNPMIGRKCVVRTFSAGVHIGMVESVDGKNVYLKDCLRLWSWEGSLSLSGVAENGITGGRLQRHSEVWLSEMVELIPCTEKAWQTYLQYVE